MRRVFKGTREVVQGIRNSFPILLPDIAL